MNHAEKEWALLKGELQTRIHIEDVNSLLCQAAQRLLVRAQMHDASKLREPEKERFALAAAIFNEPGNEFGTKGYEETKAWLGEALEHHYQHNSHHPEHYPDRVLGMNLFDVLEMLLDWSAASKRRSESGIMDLSLSQKIHNVPEPLIQIMANTASVMGLPFTWEKPDG